MMAFTADDYEDASPAPPAPVVQDGPRPHGTQDPKVTAPAAPAAGGYEAADYEDASAAKTPPLAEPDYANMPFIDALKAGWRSAPAAATQIAKNVGSSALGAAQNLTQGQLPGTSLLQAGDAWVDRNVPGAKWLGDRLGYYQRPQTEADYQKAVAPASDIVKSYTDAYGSGYAGFAKKVATDLPGVFLDAATVADPALRGLSSFGAKAAVAAPATAADVGEAFVNAAQKSKAAVDSAYKEAAAAPGEFHPDAVQPVWQKAVDTVGGSPSMTTSWDELDKAKDLPNVRGAVAYLQDQLADLYSSPGTFDMSRLERLRRGINDFANDSKSGTEKHLIGQLVDGFDQGIIGASGDPKLFRGSPAVGQTMQAARDAHVSHLENFGKNAPSAVSNAMKLLPDDLAEADADHFHAVGTKLSAGMLNSGTGALVRSHLADVGLQPVVDSHLQQQLLNGSQKEVAKNLSTPTAQATFGEDLPRAQQLNADQSKPTAGRKIAPFARAALDVGLSGFGAHAAGLPGMVLGHMAEKGLEHFLPSAEKVPLYDKFTAPPAAPIRDFGRSLRSSAARTNLSNAAGKEGEPRELLVHPARPAHARGGKVGHQHLVDRLFQHVERAKREEKAHTSSLLHQPDAAIAKALNAAQKAI